MNASCLSEEQELSISQSLSTVAENSGISEEHKLQDGLLLTIESWTPANYEAGTRVRMTVTVTQDGVGEYVPSNMIGFPKTMEDMEQPGPSVSRRLCVIAYDTLDCVGFFKYEKQEPYTNAKYVFEANYTG